MTYKYIINGTGEENFGDPCPIPLLICSSKQVAKTIKNSFTRAIKEIAPEDIDAKDIKFHDYEDKNAIFKQVRNELKYELFSIIASSDENVTALPELETKVKDIIEKLFNGLDGCFVCYDTIKISKLPYI